MATTYLTRTNGSAPTNTTKATVSCWVKRGSLANHQGIFGVRNTGNNEINVQCGFFNTKWYMWYKDGTNDQFLQDSHHIPRDVHGWYHVVFRFDTTDGTTNNRMRVYVNGESLGANFGSVDQPAQNDDIIIGTNGLEFSIGRYTFTGGSAQYFEGLISHFHYCDGYSYGPESFGSTDATTGEWKISTAPSVSYGNNGFFVLKDTNSGTDQSGNGNNLTVGGGTLSHTEDNPDNVFATMNPLGKFGGGDSTPTMLRGNNTVELTSLTAVSTIGANKGKFYCEVKVNDYQSGITLGIVNNHHNTDAVLGYNSPASPTWAKCVGYYAGNGNATTTISDGSGFGGYGSSYGAGDIIGIAMDFTNSKIYFAKNGTWQNSGDPTSGATGTGSKTMPTLASDEDYFVAYGNWSASVGKVSFNFGNGVFGTSAIASEGTNASGIGKFEYDVPTGYTALCTKGLNE